MKSAKPQTPLGRTGQPQVSSSRTTQWADDDSAGSLSEMNFKQHLQQLQKARQQTDRLMEKICPGYQATQGSIEAIAEILFDRLCEEDLEISGIGTAAGILHKLTATLAQFKNLEAKLNETIDEQNSESIQKPKSLSLETLRKIEAQLKLL